MAQLNGAAKEAYTAIQRELMADDTHMCGIIAHSDRYGIDSLTFEDRQLVRHCPPERLTRLRNRSIGTTRSDRRA